MISPPVLVIEFLCIYKLISDKSSGTKLNIFTVVSSCTLKKTFSGAEPEKLGAYILAKMFNISVASWDTAGKIEGPRYKIRGLEVLGQC